MIKRFLSARELGLWAVAVVSTLLISCEHGPALSRSREQGQVARRPTNEQEDARQAAARIALEIQRRRGGNRPINLKLGIGSDGKPTTCAEVLPAGPAKVDQQAQSGIEQLCAPVLKWELGSPEGQREVVIQFGSSHLR